jgi:hypothetical protein
MSRHATDTVPTTGFVIVNSLFVVALVSIGAYSAWPIYQSQSYLVLVGCAVAFAAAISFVGLIQRWTWFTILLVAIGTYLLIGVPLGVPSALENPAQLGPAWLQFISATVFGWKQLVTVTIPVGTYQGLLVPALFLFFFASVGALSLSWRAQRLYLLAVPILLLVPLFGLAFGSSSESPRPSVLAFPFAGREFYTGLGALLILLTFLVWRSRHARRIALRAAVGAVTRHGRANTAGSLRRAALAIIMLLVGVVVAAWVVPDLDGNDRQVLRTAIAPPINLSEFVSPLTQYRSYFDSPTYDAELFHVDGDLAVAGRLRLAVLSYYDGEVYRVTDPTVGEGGRETAFARIPSTLRPGAEGTSEKLGVTVGAYSGAWLPTAGALRSIEFSGADAGALADGMFYNEISNAAVQLHVLGDGDAYSFVATVSDAERSLESLDKPAEPTNMVDAQLIPPSLVTWVRAQSLGTDAASLQQLIDRLRARGYLSHALVEPTAADSAWLSELGDYAFEPSLSGHSLGRIDALFSSLNSKQHGTDSRVDADLVAAVGDDEQFAVATALVAQYLGFPSRVVLGFDLESSDPDVPACAGGSCTGKNLIAWVEVQGADGSWATVDVSPQHTNAIAPINDQQQDPHNLTDVLPETANEVQPPEANPFGGDQSVQNNEAAHPDLVVLIAVLRLVGASLLALLVGFAPFLTILVAKTRRRRARLRAPDVESRIVGGWDEYIDAALDFGKPLPRSETRVEIARLYATPRAIQLATMADRAVFHAELPDHATSEQFWVIVEAERRSLAAGTSRWQRIRSAVSLRSFLPHLQAEHPVRQRRARKTSSMTIGQTTVRS